jgi:hypothetical protein
MSCEYPALLMSLQQRRLISRFQERQCCKVQKRVSLLCSFDIFLFIVNNGVPIAEHIIFFFFHIALTLPKPVVIIITNASLTLKALRFPHTSFLKLYVIGKVEE